MLLNSIEHITIKDAHSPIRRKIISIHGMPFYRSTGANSSHPGTWFPFFGIQEVDTGFCYKGHFFKPFSPLFDMELLKLLTNYFPSNPFSDEMLHQRFGSHAGILLSSWLGGGLWDTQNGQLLKKDLKEKYADFYAHWPEPQISETEQEITEESTVNAWLREKANGQSPQEIKAIKLDDLIALYKPQIPLEGPNNQNETAIQDVPKHIGFLYQSNKSDLGSVMDGKGNRRSARFMRKP